MQGIFEKVSKPDTSCAEALRNPKPGMVFETPQGRDGCSGKKYLVSAMNGSEATLIYHGLYCKFDMKVNWLDFVDEFMDGMNHSALRRFFSPNSCPRYLGKEPVNNDVINRALAITREHANPFV